MTFLSPGHVSLTPVRLLVVPDLPPRQTDKQRTRKRDRDRRERQRQKLTQPPMCRAQVSLSPAGMANAHGRVIFPPSCSIIFIFLQLLSCSIPANGRRAPLPHARRMPCVWRGMPEGAGLAPSLISHQPRIQAVFPPGTLSLGGRALGLLTPSLTSTF